MLNKSFTYTYDKGGNIVSKSEYAYTAGSVAQFAVPAKILLIPIVIIAVTIKRMIVVAFRT